MRFLPLLGLTFVLAACRNESASPPPDAMLPDQFAKAYAALLEAHAARPAITTDSLLTTRSADSVLSRLGTTRERFKTTAAWYNRDVQRWRECMEEVARILDERQQKRGQ